MVATEAAPHYHGHRYMPREPLPDRRHVWRQKVTIVDENGARHTFYVDFGEYADGRLAEVFVTAHRCGDSFTRGVVDSLARSISLALQSGTSPHDMARMLRGQCYPPAGKVEAPSSCVQKCSSLADYIAQEIVACYDENGSRVLLQGDGAAEDVGTAPQGKSAGYIGPQPPGTSN